MATGNLYVVDVDGGHRRSSQELDTRTSRRGCHPTARRSSIGSSPPAPRSTPSRRRIGKRRRVVDYAGQQRVRLSGDRGLAEQPTSRSPAGLRTRRRWGCRVASTPVRARCQDRWRDAFPTAQGTGRVVPRSSRRTGSSSPTRVSFARVPSSSSSATRTAPARNAPSARRSPVRMDGSDVNAAWASPRTGRRCGPLRDRRCGVTPSPPVDGSPERTSGRRVRVRRHPAPGSLTDPICGTPNGRSPAGAPGRSAHSRRR